MKTKVKFIYVQKGSYNTKWNKVWEPNHWQADYLPTPVNHVTYTLRGLISQQSEMGQPIGVET